MDCSGLAAEVELAVSPGLGNCKHREQAGGDH